MKDTSRAARRGDTVHTALSAAQEVGAGMRVTIPAGATKRVRVPGLNVATCKADKADTVPCILVEVFRRGGALQSRWLCREVEFKGTTRMVQSVAAPCEVTGAILWLETTAGIVCH
jgi:hypothetical protein